MSIKYFKHSNENNKVNVFNDFDFKLIEGEMIEISINCSVGPKTPMKINYLIGFSKMYKCSTIDNELRSIRYVDFFDQNVLQMVHLIHSHSFVQSVAHGAAMFIKW